MSIPKERALRSQARALMTHIANLDVRMTSIGNSIEAQLVREVVSKIRRHIGVTKENIG